MELYDDWLTDGEPVMTKEDEREIRNVEDEYNFDLECEKVAQKRGLIVVIPKDNELQIDIDDEKQFIEFRRRLDLLQNFLPIDDIIEKPSASGIPNRHITLVCEHAFTECERILLQAALNDDPIRVFLNVARLLNDIPNPSRLFEKPEEKNNINETQNNGL